MSIDIFTSATKLTQDNISEQILMHGYFAEEIPNCFSSRLLAESYQKDKRYYDSAMFNDYSDFQPVTLPVYKKDGTIRVISLPNPQEYVELVEYLCQNWDKILTFTRSSHSISPIDAIVSYDNSAMLRSDRKFAGVLDNSYIIGNDIILKIDLKNCYDSISGDMLSIADNECDIMDLGRMIELVTKISKINNPGNQGIITGPFTSRILSEIVLSILDKKLTLLGYNYNRYVDDYNFTFLTCEAAKVAYKKIVTIINEFGFDINEEKTELTCVNMLPKPNPKLEYEVEPKVSFSQALIDNPHDVDKIIEGWEFSLEKELNTELKKQLKDAEQPKILGLIVALKELNLNITVENLSKALQIENDFIIIIALDFLKNHTRIIEYKPNNEYCEIQTCIKKLKLELKKTDYIKKHWLLAYEVKYHTLIEGFDSQVFNLFYEYLDKNQITFYSAMTPSV